MKAGYLQMHPIFGDVNGNNEKVKEMTKEVEFDLLVLPELFNTGYVFHNKEDYGDRYDRVVVIGCTNKVSMMSKKKADVGFFEKSFYFPYPDYATMKLLFK